MKSLRMLKIMSYLTLVSLLVLIFYLVLMRNQFVVPVNLPPELSSQNKMYSSETEGDDDGFFEDDSSDSLDESKNKSDIIKIPQFKVEEINCAALFRRDEFEKMAAVNYQTIHPRHPVHAKRFIQAAQNCDKFIRNRRYVMQPLSAEEQDFPIAFSILIFKNFCQFERLLRAIYRPQNYYCIHVDKKSDPSFLEAAKAVSSCFDNVFIASKSVDVQWGYYSVIEPELICMEDLWKKSKKWKYFINLTGQEFPLKTNGELVKILKILNGSNSIEGTILRQNPAIKEYLVNVPHKINVTKGSVHVTATRGFIDYILHSPVALDFRNFCQSLPVADEYFFSSLNYNPNLGVPGAYKGYPETDTRKNRFITRFKNWGVYPFKWPCYGMWVRQVCIFGIRDLPLLASRPELFANKFYFDFQPLTLDCMEELHYNRTRDEIDGKLRLDLGFYRDLDFVQNHVHESAFNASAVIL